MFIDTLEFTIPIDLCALYATLQEEARTQLEFPASVNSYGTTQDANVQVALRANKVTFKVDGVSSNASIISKSECKTLKLSVFDVDRTLMQKNVNVNNSVQITSNNSNAAKRMHEQSVSFPSSKHGRKSYDDSPRPRSPMYQSPRPRSPMYHSTHQKSPHLSQSSNSYSKQSNDTPVNVKQEPEDPDLIEIEPDPEPDDIEPKKENPYMHIDYSSNEPHTQTSQAALDRVSFPPTSRSQSSSSSYHQNVPHVQDYSEPGQSHHGDQSADDFLVFQDDNECNEDYEEADYSNDGSVNVRTNPSWLETERQIISDLQNNLNATFFQGTHFVHGGPKKYICQECGKGFARMKGLTYHTKAIHLKLTVQCICGKTYNHQRTLSFHQKTCFIYQTHKGSASSVQ